MPADASTPARLAVGYLRVSTDEQHLGPDAQRDALDRWCLANGYTLAAVHADLGVGGATSLDRRPGLLEALEAVKATGADVLLVAKRDRLARDPMVAAMIEAGVKRNGARILSAAGEGTDSDGPTDILMRRIVDAFAEYERLIIKSRTKAALAVKRSRGERTGQVPYGFALNADGVHLEENPAEQRVIRLVLDLRADGLSLAKVAARLNADDVPARGKSWHPTSIARMVKRAAGE
jgi:DNA invertase Pin-like site-specific DNA recombinase